MGLDLCGHARSLARTLSEALVDCQAIHEIMYCCIYILSEISSSCIAGAAVRYSVIVKLLMQKVSPWAGKIRPTAMHISLAMALSPVRSRSFVVLL